MLGLRECLELNNISVTSALTSHMSTIDSFTLKRSLKLFRWGTIVAVYWGIQGTSPNENVSKLETDRPTKSQRLWTKTDKKKGEKEEKSCGKKKKKKRVLLVSETMTFLPIESEAWAVAISMSLTELRAYQAYCITWEKKGKGRNNQKCIRNNALFRLYPSLFRHPRSFTRSEWAEGGGRGACSRSHSQRGGWVIKLCVAL